MEANQKNITNKENIKLHNSALVRWSLIISGVFLVIIGIIGVFLPLLPTTIFFILAAWCFARSSERFYLWIHNNKFFGKYLSSYKSGNGMTLKSKIFSLSFLWLGILTSAVFLTQNLYIRILLMLIAVGVTWHLAAIKTAKETD